jgi:cell division protein FtsQ
MTGQQRVKRRQNPRRKQQGLKERFGAISQKLLPALLVVSIVAGVPLVSYQAYVFAITSPSFALTEIDVRGAQHATRDDMLEVGRVATGVNIFDVEEERVAELIGEHPWIKSASVSTKLPGTLIIEVVEHEPVALVIDRGEYLFIDEQGSPFKALEASEMSDAIFDELPLISGLDRDALTTRPEARMRLMEAMSVWEMWHERGIQEIAPIAEVHLDEVLGLSLIVGAQGTEVRLGWGQWGERLDRFGVVYQDLLDRGVAVDYVLVDQDGEVNRVAVGPTQTMER